MAHLPDPGMRIEGPHAVCQMPSSMMFVRDVTASKPLHESLVLGMWALCECVAAQGTVLLGPL